MVITAATMMEAKGKLIEVGTACHIDRGIYKAAQWLVLAGLPEAEFRTSWKSGASLWALPGTDSTMVLQPSELHVA